MAIAAEQGAIAVVEVPVPGASRDAQGGRPEAGV